MSIESEMEKINRQIERYERKIGRKKQQLLGLRVGQMLTDILNRAIAEGKLEAPDFSYDLSIWFVNGRFQTQPPTRRRRPSTSVRSADGKLASRRGKLTDRQATSEHWGIPTTSGSTEYYAQRIRDAGYREVEIEPSDL